MGIEVSEKNSIAEEHILLTRRYFLQMSGAGLAAMTPKLGYTQGNKEENALQQAISKLPYLTRDADFSSVERGTPLPYTLPEAKLREIGMTRETWKLEVVPDIASGTKVDFPLSKERGTALDWAGLMKLAEKHAVRYLKVVTCNNLNDPLGMGLWEGVPLREVIWLTRPVSDIRRVFYYGHHNEDTKQMFRSSLPLGRILEDPPGEYPVILCYKLNGEFLSGKRGGPVRMIVPEAYGFKSIKWLQRVVLTNQPAANDTYADGNNDIDSWMKTFARFITVPPEVRAGSSIPVTGVAQVGISGLSKVQYWLNKQSDPLPTDDPYFTKAPWRDAQMLARLLITRTALRSNEIISPPPTPLPYCSHSSQGRGDNSDMHSPLSREERASGRGGGVRLSIYSPLLRAYEGMGRRGAGVRLNGGKYEELNKIIGVRADDNRAILSRQRHHVHNSL